MVSPQRIWDKLNRAESKIMAYHTMIEKKQVPLDNDTVNFRQSRWGEEATGIELARAHQAMFDIKQDIKRNIAKLDLDWKDYENSLEERNKNDLIAILKGIADPSKKKKKTKKEAKT